MEPTAATVGAAARAHKEAGPSMLAQEAMGTVFAITATDADPVYAQQAIRAAMEELAWIACCA